MRDSLERIIPAQVLKEDEHACNSLDLHYARYLFAAKHVLPGEALDIACGVGYGSDLLARNCKEVGVIHGVDCSQEAIAYAESHFNNPLVKFYCEKAEPFLERHCGKFSTIVSLETVEHLVEPQRFISACHGALSKNGIAVFSVPVSPTIDINPHHLTDFSRKSILKLLAKCGFEPIDEFEQLQEVTLGGLLKQNSYRTNRKRSSMLRFYLANPSSLVRRLVSCVRDGFSTRYLTVAVRKIDQ